MIPVDLWIDGESRLRKIVITRPATNGTDDPDAPVATMTVELYDYGVDVDVQPPEGELISEEELDQLTDGFGLVTEEGGEAEACEPQGPCREDKKP